MTSTQLAIKHPIPIRGGRNDVPRPPVIEIKRSTSLPTDPDAPSFLTTLPPEIRNTIYEMLFQLDEPIEIVNKWEQREWPSWIESGEFSDDDEEAKLEAMWYMHQESYGLRDGIRLLRVCRQVFHEAVGVLYSSNTFCVTAPEHRHNRGLPDLAVAADFLQSIGSHQIYVTNLIIDLDRLCPDSCYDEAILDLLPLLRVLWSRPSMRSKVSFAHTGNKLHPKVHGPSDYQDGAGNCASQMNKMLRSFVETDLLNIRRYGRFERLIQHVYIDFDATYPQGHEVVYGDLFDSYRYERTNHAEFELDTIDCKPRWKGSRAHLNRLPQSVYRRILRSVLTSDTPITFDLNTATVLGLDVSLLHLDFQARRYAQRKIGMMNRVILKLVSRENQTSFTQFEELRDWLEGPYGCLLCNKDIDSGDRNIDTGHPPTVSLQFIRCDDTLASLRIDVLSLIRLTYDFNKDTVIEFSIRPTDSTTSIFGSYRTSLQMLRQRCFILLSALMLKKQNTIDVPAPQIWIDGTAAAIEVTWSDPEPGRIRRGSGHPLDVTSLLSSGREYIRKVMLKDGTQTTWPWTWDRSIAFRFHALDEDDTLEALWHTLRVFDWCS